MTSLAPALERPSVFKPRKAIKPYEFPEVIEAVDAIRSAYWTPDHFKFHKDVQDFHSLPLNLRQPFSRTLLAISQVEVEVKEFWAGLYGRFPKSEFSSVGSTFAECETRHMDTYSKLLTDLGLESEFHSILQVPAIGGRVEYVTNAMTGKKSDDIKEYVRTLTLFSLFIENVSLFSQFLIVKSFSKHLNMMHAVDNAVQATQKEELVHGKFGIYLVNLIKAERPDLFDDEFYEGIQVASLKAYKAELGILQWIFELGELEFLPISHITALLRDRFNESVVGIGGREPFEVTSEELHPIRWFREEIDLAVSPDFFHKKSANYHKKKVDPRALF